jgi:hypothetical protein
MPPKLPALAPDTRDFSAKQITPSGNDQPAPKKRRINVHVACNNCRIKRVGVRILYSHFSHGADIYSVMELDQFALNVKNGILNAIIWPHPVMKPTRLF